jgi:hypothetical protein
MPTTVYARRQSVYTFNGGDTLKRNPYNSEKRRKELDRKKKKEEKKQKKIDRQNQIIDPLTGLPVVDAVVDEVGQQPTDHPGADGAGSDSSGSGDSGSSND